MSFAKVSSAQNVGLQAHIVDIEVDLSKGLHSFNVVGLPDKAVEESKDRVSAAIKHCGFDSPKSKNQKVVVALAPADIRKEGPLFDLPIALCYLLAAKEIRFDPADKLFLGELSLDGEVRKIRGVLPLVAKAAQQGFKEVYAPMQNIREAAFVRGIKVYGVPDLKSVVAHLDSRYKKLVSSKNGVGQHNVDSQNECSEDFGGDLSAGEPTLLPQPPTELHAGNVLPEIDFSDISGHENAKRVLEIAAAGGHNVAFYGPAGTGKTILAKALAGIMPPLSFEETMEVTGIHSVAGSLEDEMVVLPPFRSPHHTASYVSMIGGGAIPRPGEITLAHRGILFLDEFPEYDRRVIETLRQPMEERTVVITRAKAAIRFPANFILVAAFNPCPCGNFGSDKICSCPPFQITRYQRKLSGPIIDRIDLWVQVPRLTAEKMSELADAETSAEIKKRVLAARNSQKTRFEKLGLPFSTNSEIDIKTIRSHIPLTDECKAALNSAANKMGFSGRTYHRVIKISRTIADLAGEKGIAISHIMESLQYRPKETSGF